MTGLVPWSIAPPSERLEVGGKTGPNPTDRVKLGRKHHVITDANGIPLASILTGANRHDVTQLMALVEAIPLRSMHIKALTAKRGTDHGSGLGAQRWVVERTLAWLHQFRRLRVRYERRADIHEAFVTIGCSLICFKRLPSF